VKNDSVREDCKSDFLKHHIRRETIRHFERGIRVTVSEDLQDVVCGESVFVNAKRRTRRLTSGESLRATVGKSVARGLSVCANIGIQPNGSLKCCIIK
jgi:hypothetical protein